MATRNIKPEDAIVSLDEQFYWIHEKSRRLRAIEDLTTDGELVLRIGDICQTESERRKPRRGGGAYVLVTNTRTGQKGLLVPKHKLEVVVEPLDFDML